MWNNGFSWNNGFLSCGCGGSGCGNCRTGLFPAQPCPPKFPPNCNNGCPILLDSNCVIYHQFNNQISGLKNLNLGNGSTLQLILDTIDVQLGVLNAAAWAVPNLRADGFTINTLPQFAAAVDTELGVIANEITVLQGLVGVPITPVNTNSIDLAVSGPLNHTLTANVNISGATGNTLVVLSDGLYAAPQLLSINYVAKTLSITGGNTVDFSSLLCQAGWQGDVTTDPTGLGDGNYWFNTTSGQLKIRLNGATRVITIT